MLNRIGHGKGIESNMLKNIWSIPDNKSVTCREKAGLVIINLFSKRFGIIVVPAPRHILHVALLGVVFYSIHLFRLELLAALVTLLLSRLIGHREVAVMRGGVVRDKPLGIGTAQINAVKGVVLDHFLHGPVEAAAGIGAGLFLFLRQFLLLRLGLLRFFGDDLSDKGRLRLLQRNGSGKCLPEPFLRVYNILNCQLEDRRTA